MANDSGTSANETETDSKERHGKKRVSRKLTKKRPESYVNRRPRSMARMTASGMEIPERFRHADDEKEDVTAMPDPLGKSRRGDMGIQYGNRSVFSLITTAGSNINSDFSTAFGGESSGDEDEGDDTETERAGNGRTSRDERLDTHKTTHSLQSTKNRPAEPKKDHRPPLSGEKRHHRKLSGHKFFKALPRLNLRTSSGLSKTSPALTSEDTKNLSPEVQSPINSPTSPRSSQDDDGSMTTSIVLKGRDPKRNAPMMSSMLEAEAQLSTRPSSDMPRTSRQDSMPQREVEDKDNTLSNSLAMRLMDIFHFEEAEEVIQEYPCWLLKSVLLQGYMYITQKHICFYAYLPKKTNEIVKSGYLAKRGKQNPKYHRYWFKLSGDVLSYYSDPANLYFPQGSVDLSYGISAEVAEKDKGKDATHFTVVTHQRKYYFKADSIPSAKEWVKSLQKIIFRSRNEGDSVKISLPIENIIDIEDAPVVDFAETCKIRVIDNDETYAIDEYFFSFFSLGKEAFELLQNLVEDTTAQQIPPDLLHFSANQDGAGSPRDAASKRSSMHLAISPPIRASTPLLEESVRATLSPLLPPKVDVSRSASGDRQSFDGVRKSMDFGRARRSMDINRMPPEHETGRSASANRRSTSLNRLTEIETSDKQGSSASYVQSLEEPGSSAISGSAADETLASASQILRGSDVFTSPTIQRSHSKHRKSKGRDYFLSQSPERIPDERPQPKHAITTGSLASSNGGQVEPSTSTPTLHSIMKVGSYPLQRAAGLAGYLTKNSKRMSSLLATESMGYVEKVSGMWKGGKRHYDTPQGGPIADGETDDEYEGDAEQIANANQRFHAHFALPEREKLHAAYFGYLHRVLPLYGKLYISDRSFCFRSLLPGTRTKLILPLKDIYTVDKEKGFRFGYSGLVIAIKGHEEIFFEFGALDTRDDCVVTLLLHLEEVKYLKESGLLTLEEKERAEAAVAENKALQEARQRVQLAHNPKPPGTVDDTHQVLFDDPRASILNFKPTQSLRITCLTIGSRGDVQPYIALCKGLLAEGHKPKIATHMEFKSFVEDNGIAFEPVDGDPAELMRICVDNGMFTVSFLREAQSKFRGWIDMLLTSAWKACQNTDVLIESPSAMAGIHIAEALEIPYFRAFTMPWTRTRAYPHAFAVPNAKRGGAYNIMSYVMFDNIFWTFTSGQINRWRKKELGLPSTSLVKLEPNKVPFLYNFSPNVVVPPIDYSDWIRITGYWFFDESKSIPGWKPPPEIVAFIRKARADGKKIVYIGFGSITVPDAADLLKTCCESVLKADVRCILSKGWSDRLDSAHRDKYAPLLASKNLPPDTPVTVSGEIVVVPEDVLIIKSCAHDWLFSQIDAAAHHGGAGTTGASLRAGLPTIIKPFFGDQFFFGRRVEELGVGICLKVINKAVLSRALFFACNEERMVSKAKVLGEAIRQEDGVDTAIQAIYRDLEYAKTLIKRRNGKPVNSHSDAEGGGVDEESWTFIGDESGDPDLLNRIKEWEGLVVDGRTPGGKERRAIERDPVGSFEYGVGPGQSEKSLGKRVLK